MGKTVIQQLQACVARGAGGVLAGVKPAALLNFVPRGPARPSRERAFRRQAHLAALELDRALACRGVRVDVLLVSGLRALVLVRRSGGILHTLEDAEARAFLAERGYVTDTEPHVVACLRRRLRAYELGRGAAPASADPCDGCGAQASCPRRNPWRAELGYPHEMGVLLGYPLADVRAFIARQGRGGTAVGAWKTYGDAAVARASWERLRACERDVLRRYEGGATLEELIA